MVWNRNYKWLLVAAIVIGFSAWGIYRVITPSMNDEITKPTPTSAAKKQSLVVDVCVIEPKLMTERLLISGSLIPDEEVDLQFETSGKITDLLFNEGSTVQKGTLLGKVNDSQLQAQLKRLEAQLPLAEARVYRQSELLGHQAVSQEALEQVSAELNVLKADIDNMKASIDKTELRAPFDGVIGLRQVSVGTYASPTTVVAKLTKTSPLKVEFSVPERYAKDVKAGSQLNFTVDGLLDPFEATVYAVEARVDPTTHTLPVRALYPNTDHRLEPGRYAHVTLTSREIPDALAVPSEALVPEMGINKVYLYRNGKAEPVDIEIGIRTDREVQVVRGLTPGDTVITSGTLQLRKDMPVVLRNSTY